jgi:hypothetical protein
VERRRTGMADVVYLALIVVGFALLMATMRGLQRL